MAFFRKKNQVDKGNLDLKLTHVRKVSHYELTMESSHSRGYKKITEDRIRDEICGKLNIFHWR